MYLNICSQVNYEEVDSVSKKKEKEKKK